MKIIKDIKKEIAAFKIRNAKGKYAKDSK
jgi:hypothetical protein